jgi:hypothetical protein
MTRLIGLYSSAPGCGKSTVAKILVKQHDFAVQPFAAPVKSVSTTFIMQFGYSKEEAEYYLYEAKNVPIDRIPGKPTGRRIMQVVGTDMARNLIHPDCWVVAWASSSFGCSVVADDMRFEGEARAISERGGQWWRIVRPGHEVETCGHESEGRLDDLEFDQVIINDGTEKDLAQKVAAALNA